MICEAPIMLRGAQYLADAIINWASAAGSVEIIIIVGGIAQGNHSPVFLQERKALLLQNTQAEDKTNRNFSSQPA